MKARRNCPKYGQRLTKVNWRKRRIFRAIPGRRILRSERRKHTSRKTRKNRARQSNHHSKRKQRSRFCRCKRCRLND